MEKKEERNRAEKKWEKIWSNERKKKKKKEKGDEKWMNEKERIKEKKRRWTSDGKEANYHVFYTCAVDLNNVVLRVRPLFSLQ